MYNTGGYDSLLGLRMLEGTVDIYMPDLKYTDPKTAARLSASPAYPRINQRAIKEMHRQVGDLEINEQGLAIKGLLVRHLVLPGDLSGSREAMRFLAEEISPDAVVSLMGQYYPAYRARDYLHLTATQTGKSF